MRSKLLLAFIIYLSLPIITPYNCKSEDYPNGYYFKELNPKENLPAPNENKNVHEAIPLNPLLQGHDPTVLLWEEDKIEDNLLDFVYDSLPPVPVWTMNCDGSVKNATVTDMPDDDQIRSNLSLIKMQTNQSFNYTLVYNPMDIVPGKTRTAKWGLTVIDISVDAKAVITFVDKRGNDTTITVEYFAPKTIINPNYSDFGPIKKGNIVFRDFWLYNTSSTLSEEVDRLELKYNNNGFTLYNINLPFTLAPNDSVRFSVKFETDKEGIFIDSIGVGDTCVFFNRAMVKAEAINSVIDVSDINFDDTPIRKKASSEFTIKNSGNVDLIIHGYDGPRLSVFTAYLPQIDQLHPLTIPPGEEVSYKVDFNPELETLYSDSIVFFSDASKIDSIAYLNGLGNQPGMIASSYDWGTKRIKNIYAVDTSQAIVLENTSDFAVTIHSIAFKTDKRGYGFEFDRNAFDNLTIPVNGSFRVPVRFHPDSLGEYELVIIFDNTVNSQTECRLHGIGVKPLVRVQDVRFDTSVVNKFTNPIFNTVRFTNVDWQYADTLTIFDIKVLPSGNEISTNFNNYGTEGFKFDKQALNLPISLLPGQYLDIPVYFVATRKGILAAELRSLSDADSDVTANLTGNGIVEGISVKPDHIPQICFGTKDTIIYKIENIGNGTININSIKLIQNLKQFYFDNPSDAFGFTLNSGQNERVKLIYEPVVPGESLADLIVYNSTLDESELHNDVRGDAIQIKSPPEIVIPAEQLKPDIGDRITGSIFLTPGNNLDSANVKQLSVRISYNGNILKIVPESLQLGSLIEGKFSMNNLDIKDNPGEISFTLDTIDGIPFQFLSGTGEIIKFAFDTYYPLYNVSPVSKIIPDIKPINNLCVAFPLSDTVSIEFNPVCMQQLRQIELSKDKFSLLPINPNPVTNTEVKITYSVGYECPTQINIYDSYGKLVSKLVNGISPEGVFGIKYNTQNLSSGLYFCRMSSGPYNSIQQFIVDK